jgi:tRNA(Ile)-lysidine synthase
MPRRLAAALPTIGGDRAGSDRAAEPVADAEIGALFAPWRSAAGILLAVSGGPDSMALLALAARWQHLLPRVPAIAVATVDHGLRKASRAEARMVGDVAARLGLPHRRLVWQGEKPRTGLQAAARAARYALLARYAGRIGAEVVLTAHSEDDQAETLLLRLAAGSRIDGLAAMRPQSDRGGWQLGRPLLGIARARLRATCLAQALPFVDDPSNADPAFARVRLRSLLPALAGEGLTARRLAEFASHAATVSEALDVRAAAVARDLAATSLPAGPFDFTGIAGEPAEIRYRLLLRLIRGAAAHFGLPEVDIRHHRLRSLGDNLSAGFASGAGHSATLAGLRIALTQATRLEFRPAPPRRQVAAHRKQTAA